MNSSQGRRQCQHVEIERRALFLPYPAVSRPPPSAPSKFHQRLLNALMRGLAAMVAVEGPPRKGEGVQEPFARVERRKPFCRFYFVE